LKKRSATIDLSGQQFSPLIANQALVIPELSDVLVNLGVTL
jgi:hypothetical protein